MRALDQADPRARAIQTALQGGNQGNLSVRGWGDDLTRLVISALNKQRDADVVRAHLPDLTAEEREQVMADLRTLDKDHHP